MSKNKKHTIWSNLNLETKDWEEGYRENLEMNGFSEDEISEELTDEKILDFAIETNDEYLDDEKLNLDIDLPADIIAIADVGRWNGRVMGYKIIGNNIKDCLTSGCEYAEWYVDAYGNLRFTGYHHDGTNNVLYRMFRPLSDEQRENFTNKIYFGKVTNADISRYTVRIGDYIADVYGWKFSGKRPYIARTACKAE